MFGISIDEQVVLLTGLREPRRPKRSMRNLMNPFRLEVFTLIHLRIDRHWPALASPEQGTSWPPETSARHAGPQKGAVAMRAAHSGADHSSGQRQADP